MIGRVVITACWGALVGGVLAAVAFLVGALLDGTQFGEAFGYSLVVAVIGALLGGIVGAIVGIGDFGLVGGALSGLLVTLVVAALYVLGFSRAGEYGRFLGESRIILVVLAIPLILTGVAAAWLKARRQTE